jgi:hypothetical protein
MRDAALKLYYDGDPSLRIRRYTVDLFSPMIFRDGTEPTDAELDRYAQQVSESISLVRPHHIVLLGSGETNWFSMEATNNFFLNRVAPRLPEDIILLDNTHGMVTSLTPDTNHLFGSTYLSRARRIWPNGAAYDNPVFPMNRSLYMGQVRSSFTHGRSFNRVVTSDGRVRLYIVPSSRAFRDFQPAQTVEERSANYTDQEFNDFVLRLLFSSEDHAGDSSIRAWTEYFGFDRQALRAIIPEGGRNRNINAQARQEVFELTRSLPIASEEIYYNLTVEAMLGGENPADSLTFRRYLARILIPNIPERNFLSSFVEGQEVIDRMSVLLNDRGLGQQEAAELGRTLIRDDFQENPALSDEFLGELYGLLREMPVLSPQAYVELPSALATTIDLPFTAAWADD